MLPFLSCGFTFLQLTNLQLVFQFVAKASRFKILYSHKPMHYNGTEINTNIQSFSAIFMTLFFSFMAVILLF